ncbi:hypothetical protein DICPUDRAFT_96678 [Dictyostelium purpureum]|uniref:Kinesin motor domain-containing protein n=1 Tax=Dictyostelium purpureum TaxID=5786 RepID=F0ZAG5_DICPU|nr:uncharacterized protein DICPUDRAFT_96678 [Dictyostelium purpureum]EGC39048.1 hypothetical protein DICPUDRAFT_96678 [Dictyostelium purpureum]|eukprot:XP_003284398.1 hypothetical protein DICPUDRAFT_96678 [Dictyostelium purpureum]
MENYESTPKSQLRSRSHSTPSTPTPSTAALEKTPAVTPGVTPSIGRSLVFSSKDNAKKVLNMDTPANKKRSSTTQSGIPPPPSQLSGKKDPSRRNSSFLGRPSTPQPTPTNSLNSSGGISNPNNPTTTTTTTTSTTSTTNASNATVTTSIVSNNSNTTATTTITTPKHQKELNFSELLQNNNLDIINQNSAFSSVQKSNTSSSSLSSSSNSTPSPTLLPPSISLLPPDLSLDGNHYNNNNSNNNNSYGLNLSPNSQFNNNTNILNRSSSPSPNGRRTPTSFLIPITPTPFLKPSSLNNEREENIMVYCRFRPEIQSEKNLSSSEKKLTIGEDGRTIHITSPQNSTAYRFSKVFQPTTTQESFYNEVARPLVDDVLNGFNVGIIAYGQTGAGKTYTQFGKDIGDELPLTEQEGYGITPRFIKDLLNRVNYLSSDRVRFTVRVSYLELYREKLYDLINDKAELDIRMSDNGFNAPDASQPPIQSFADFLHYIHNGEKNRSYGDNKKNMNSSRSHVLFIATILKEDLENKDSFLSSLYIVDLAGSESVSQTGATGSRLDETKSINKSLFALGGVIEDMAKKSKKSQHVRYRDSNLTKLLHSCFGGNSKTHLIVNCSSSNNETVLRDTTQSLSFAERTQSVKNKPQVNVELSNHQLKQYIQGLKSENSHLRKFIESNSSNMGTISPSQISSYIVELQNSLEQYKTHQELLDSNIRNLEDDINQLEEQKRVSEEEKTLMKQENNKKFEECNQDFKKIQNLFEESNRYIKSLEDERAELQERIEELTELIEDLQNKYKGLQSQEVIMGEELEKSLNEREDLLGHLNKIKEKNKEMEKDKFIADELRIKLTNKEDLIVNLNQEIEQLNTQKIKWKNKSQDNLKQKNQLEEQLKLLQTTNDINENEKIRNQSYRLLELQSQLTLSMEREELLKKETETTKNKNNEQTIILQNFKNQMDTLTNKIEIEFPTIVNTQKKIQQQIQQQSSSSSSNSVETNLIVSITTLENLFEKIIKKQEQTNTIINTNTSSIMEKLVEIDENEEFIKKEREKDSINLNNNSKIIEEIQSNFLQKQEEIKQLIKDHFNNNLNDSNSINNNLNNNSNSKNNKSANNNNNNIDKSIKKGGRNSKSSNSICMNILIVIVGIIVLFFLMVGVGLTIQQHDGVPYNSNFYKAT